MTRRVRRLTPEDTAEARALYAELFEDNAVGSAADFARLLAHEGTSVWGAFDQDALVAMVTLHILPNMTYGAQPYAIIENVVTGKAVRGQGHGRRAMQGAIDAAWREGAYKIMLQTGRARGARAFYEKLGFSDTEKYGLILRRLPAELPSG